MQWDFRPNTRIKIWLSTFIPPVGGPDIGPIEAQQMRPSWRHEGVEGVVHRVIVRASDVVVINSTSISAGGLVLAWFDKVNTRDIGYYAITDKSPFMYLDGSGLPTADFALMTALLAGF